MADIHARIAPWNYRFLQPARYKSAWSGRGAGKSHGFAQNAVLRMANMLDPWYERGAVRIAAARQFQNSIAESVKQVVEHYIRLWDLEGPDEFTITNRSIDHANGSHCWFPGIDRHPESLMSAEGIDVFWLEQAETAGDEMEKIIPTIRKPGSELWFSWNPNTRNGWCWRRFVVNPRPGDVLARISYLDNPWFPAELEEERLAMQREEPGRYAHVWLGEPDDLTDELLLPYGMVDACVEAYRKGLAPSMDHAPFVDCGLDIAEGGRNQCCLVARRGPTIIHCETWPGISGDLSMAAKRAHRIITEAGWQVSRLYYDGASPMRSEFARLGVPYLVRAVGFGMPPDGPDVMFETGRPNKHVFARKNAQMGFALRLRGARTMRLLKGDDVNPLECLFISDDIPNLEAYKEQLIQPTRAENVTTGKWTIDKAPDGADSPDKFDASSLAFCRDSQHGLRAR